MICIFLFLCFITVTTLEDPCFTTKLIDDWRRSVANGASSQICDNVLEEGWYRVISGSGELMPTVCPYWGFRCGTTIPFWLSSSEVTGSLYPDNGSIVNRTTCGANYYGDCCEKTIDIRIKDCGCYYVYYLKPTTGCYSAYCFGNQLPCPDGLTSSTGFTPGCTNSSY
ncbi:oncoprotein-induced transcript 3 protein-like [Mytilus californianus]|uniref:oncoprotein-induced transcript 3 protein-like n=1 Tax=Mytilus californianus TaxID=6549 RepID=UPI00224557DF|nr:oncoprotein-induced transcript 3 protein-like [Mytilus californianus]